MTSEGEARAAADALAAEHGLLIPDRLIDGDRGPLTDRVLIYNAPTGFPAGWWVMVVFQGVLNQGGSVTRRGH